MNPMIIVKITSLMALDFNCNRALASISGRQVDEINQIATTKSQNCRNIPQLNRTLVRTRIPNNPSVGNRAKSSNLPQEIIILRVKFMVVKCMPQDLGRRWIRGLDDKFG